MSSTTLPTTMVAPPPAPPDRPRSRRLRRPGRPRLSRPRLSRLRRWVSPVLLIGLWQVLGSTGVLDERTLAAPSQIIATGIEYTRSGVLPDAVVASVQRVGWGFLIGAVVAVVLAVVAGLSRLGEDAVDPIMQMLRTLPHLGLISLFISWMGIGEEPKIALISLGVTFPLYLNTFAGIRSIDRKTLEAAQSLHLTWSQRIRHVVLPGALPQTLVGLRQSLGIAWLTLIVAEQISAREGLGYMINRARDFQQTDVIVLGLAAYSILGLLTDAIVRYLERRALAWRS